MERGRIVVSKQVVTRKPISTKTHGFIDYLWAGLVPVLPRLLGLTPGTNRLLTLSSVGTLVYSLFTRYELGAVKRLPMKVHLAFDLVHGLILVMAALWPGKDKKSRSALLGLALVALMVTANTQRLDRKKSRFYHLG